MVILNIPNMGPLLWRSRLLHDPAMYLLTVKRFSPTVIHPFLDQLTFSSVSKSGDDDNSRPPGYNDNELSISSSTALLTMPFIGGTL